MTTNISPYAQNTFVALLDAYRTQNPKGWIHEWTLKGLRGALKKPTLKGVAVQRVKQMMRDTFLQNPEWLFCPTNPYVGPLLEQLAGPTPPAPKSKAPSCRSDWYLDTLISFFEAYSHNQQTCQELLASWAERYAATYAKGADHSVHMSRFKEAFEPINRLHGGQVGVPYQKKVPEQLTLALPEPQSESEKMVDLVSTEFGTIVKPDDPLVEETRLVIDEFESNLDYQKALQESSDVISAVSIIKTPNSGDEYEPFLNDIKLQDLLVNSPIDLYRASDENGNPYNWRDYSSIITRWPLLGIKDDQLIMCSINYWDDNGRKIYMGGYLQIDGLRRVFQRDLKQILHIQATTGEKPHCHVGEFPLRAGLGGKCWVNTEGSGLGDDEKAYRWFVVLPKTTFPPVLGKRPIATNDQWDVWLVPEFKYAEIAIKFRKESQQTPGM